MLSYALKVRKCGAQPLFSEVSFAVREGDRIGLFRPAGGGGTWQTAVGAEPGRDAALTGF